MFQGVAEFILGVCGCAEMVTTGDARIHGRDAVAPLPKNSGDKWAR